MSDLRWYRSLYWRVAAGLVGLLALLAVAEAALFLWATDRIAGSMPARSPRRLAVLVASDVGTALTADTGLDLEMYVREQYGEVLQPFVVIMRDGRVASNHDDLDPELLEEARAERGPNGPGARGRGPFPPFGAPRPRGDGPPDFAPRDAPESAPRRRPEEERDGGRGFRPPPFRGGEVAAILVDGRPVGRVAVVAGRPPLSRIVRALGPTLGLVAGVVLGIGTLLVAVLIFGPTRRRLLEMQHATERLAAGDTEARAPERGGDEVAAVARSFNRMADELTSRARALDASDRARRQLLADVSHELMTPLTAMRGYLETLSMIGTTLDEATRTRYVRIAEEETHRLERIIGDLLDLARLDGGGGTLRHEPVAVAGLFARVAERHEREIAARGINLVREIVPDVDTIIGDPDRLEQALQNLAANALRHTPDAGRIALRAFRDADGVHLVVHDSGHGIPAEHLPLIFDRFYKADAARSAAGGSGLGLSIVKAIVERHGGTIRARNERGALFEIVLPTGSHGEDGGDGDFQHGDTE